MSTSFDRSRSLVRDLANTTAMSAAMVATAKVGQNWAEGNAPRSGLPKKPGTAVYADSFEVQAVDLTVDGQTRKGAALVNTAPHASAVEWVNGAHVLARAVDAIERGT
jgi:hypothetical protein